MQSFNSSYILPESARSGVIEDVKPQRYPISCRGSGTGIPSWAQCKAPPRLADRGTAGLVQGLPGYSRSRLLRSIGSWRGDSALPGDRPPLPPPPLPSRTRGGWWWWLPLQVPLSPRGAGLASAKGCTKGQVRAVMTGFYNDASVLREGLLREVTPLWDVMWLKWPIWGLYFSLKSKSFWC